jgi:hypothetical protein
MSKCVNDDLKFELSLLEDLNRRKSNLLYKLNEDVSSTLSCLNYVKLFYLAILN